MSSKILETLPETYEAPEVGGGIGPLGNCWGWGGTTGQQCAGPGNTPDSGTCALGNNTSGSCNPTGACPG
jgi:hypothetical protein